MKLIPSLSQRVKQLKARIKKRNLEEQKREERVEQAKNALWEEHQKQVKHVWTIKMKQGVLAAREDTGHH